MRRQRQRMGSDWLRAGLNARVEVAKGRVGCVRRRGHCRILVRAAEGLMHDDAVWLRVPVLPPLQ